MSSFDDLNASCAAANMLLTAAKSAHDSTKAEWTAAKTQLGVEDEARDFTRKRTGKKPATSKTYEFADLPALAQAHKQARDSLRSARDVYTKAHKDRADAQAKMGAA